MNVTLPEQDHNLGTIGGKRKLNKSFDSGFVDTKHAGHGKRVEGSTEKRVRRETYKDTIPDEADKENFHRSRPLAPRSRPTAVLASLVIDAPTDCSDIEFEDDEDQFFLGSVYRAQLGRISDPKREHYHFNVYEDSVVN